MKARQLPPALFMLLFSAGAIGAYYNVPQGEACITIEPKEENVPTYTYLSPYVELSPYDEHFREAADSTGYDWKLIAAIAYTESRFDSTAVSRAGAKGVMQVMPRTMRGFSIPDSMHADNYTNIMTAAKYLKNLEKQRLFRNINPDERIKFVLASYNAGYGHVSDAMRLAKKYGYNRHKWEKNVDSFLIHINKPKYYKDALCLHGRFRGWRETLSYVKKVKRNWRRFSAAQQNYTDSIMNVIAQDSTKKIMQ
jgi:membrane-bound lytic murein transglycosylase MltF